MIRLLGVNLDITEQEERDAALEESAAQLRSIFENVPDAMVLIGEDGSILSFSSAAERVFGYAAAQVLGAQVAILLPEAEAEANWPQRRIARYLDTGEAEAFGQVLSVSGRRSDGTLFPAELTVGEARSRSGRLFIAFIRDISERLDAQRRLDELRDEFAHSARLMAMGEIAAGLAHELNQPLAASANFLGAAEMVRAQSDSDEELGELMSAARVQLMRAGEIIRRLRDFLARGHADMREEMVEKTLQEAIALGLVGNSRDLIDVQCHIAEGAEHMFADRVQIQQVLVNLLRNAAKVVRELPRERRTITILAEPVDEHMLQLSVSDMGPGLPPAMLDQLDVPFAASGGGGMGFGLSICRRIIDAHGGEMAAANLPDGGASIAFTLPKGGLVEAVREAS